MYRLKFSCTFHHILGMIFLFIFSGCHLNKREIIKFSGKTMGTSFMVKYIKPQHSNFDQTLVEKKVQDILDDVNAKMSTYIPESELSRFNSSTQTGWIDVSNETLTVILKALEIGSKTQGAFDVTIGPLVNLWGFGPVKRTQDFPPSKEQITKQLSLIGQRYLMARENPPSIKKEINELYVDLSSIAKGYAVDLLANFLLSQKLSNFMVEVGGEIKAFGKNAKSVPWKIALERPDIGKRSVYRILQVNGMAVATSGDYRNFYVHSGQSYSHTIDPRTGRPINHQTTSVTVAHANCMEADAWATALDVLGAKKGLEVAKKYQLAAYFLVKKADGKFMEMYTPRFQDLILSSD